MAEARESIDGAGVDGRPASPNPEKARRAARDKDRPGVNCRAEPGAWEVAVDRSRCEGKADCVEVCPYGVFEVGTLPADEYRGLPFFVRLKVRVHGMKTAFTPHLEACQACGLCVVACPENAITLVERAPAGEAGR